MDSAGAFLLKILLVLCKFYMYFEQIQFSLTNFKYSWPCSLLLRVVVDLQGTILLGESFFQYLTIANSSTARGQTVAITSLLVEIWSVLGILWALFVLLKFWDSCVQLPFCVQRLFSCSYPLLLAPTHSLLQWSLQLGMRAVVCYVFFGVEHFV